MIVKIEDLKVGDKILVPTGSSFKSLIVVKEPVKDDRGLSWKRYKSVRCSANIEVKMVDDTKWDYAAQKRVPYKRKEKTWHHGFDNHNTRISIVLDWKDIWLVERGMCNEE